MFMVIRPDYKKGNFGNDIKILKSDELDEVVIWFTTNDCNGNEKYIDIRMDKISAKILGQTIIKAAK